MKQQGLLFFTDIHLTVVGLMVFFLWFLGICYWVFRVVPKSHYRQESQKPLRDEEILL